MMVKCPPVESLDRLLNDRLNKSDREVFEAHIEDCSHCQEALRLLSQRMPALIQPYFVRALARSDPAHRFGGQELQFLNRLTQSMLAEQSERVDLGTDDSNTDRRPTLEGYELLEELGRGAAGVVYRARHRKLNRLVAIKMIQSGLHFSSSAQQRFRQEAQAIARLLHPNIVQVYDFGEHAGCPYFSLELVEGDNLARWLGGVPRSAVESARIIETLARAIDYAHSRGVVHRDLKPSNVLLGANASRSEHRSSDGSEMNRCAEFDLKITDFGLAKFLPGTGAGDDRMTQSGTIVGTPAYVAPEQARGDTSEVGPAADIYSLGVILYELLTGKPPFQGATPMETLLQTVHREPVSPARLVPHIPRDLETICLKCLEKDWKRRYSTAGELAADLERFRLHEPIQARPVNRARRCIRWARRRPVHAMLLAIVVTGSIAPGTTELSSRLREAERIRTADNQLREVAQFAARGEVAGGERPARPGKGATGQRWSS